jgi:hypothetical protein
MVLYHAKRTVQAWTSTGQIRRSRCVKQRQILALDPDLKLLVGTGC